MRGPAYTEVTCRYCGQVERRYRGLRALTGWMRDYCRMCGTVYGKDKPSPISMADAGLGFLGYYVMMAFVWAAIVGLPAGLFAGIFLELEARQTLMTVALLAGAAIGLVKADKQRRRGEVIHRRELQGDSSRQGVSSGNQLDQEGP